MSLLHKSTCSSPVREKGKGDPFEFEQDLLRNPGPFEWSRQLAVDKKIPRENWPIVSHIPQRKKNSEAGQYLSRFFAPSPGNGERVDCAIVCAPVRRRQEEWIISRYQRPYAHAGAARSGSGKTQFPRLHFHLKLQHEIFSPLTSTTNGNFSNYLHLFLSRHCPAIEL